MSAAVQDVAVFLRPATRRQLAIGLALLSIFAVSGCDNAVNPALEGTPDAAPTPPPADAAPTTDAAPTGDGGGGGGGGGSFDGPCEDQVTTPLHEGHHPPRFDFINGSRGCKGGPCHNGTNGPNYSVGGAVYSQAESGGVGVAGAHVYIVDSVGREFHTVTAKNGFFWLDDQGVLNPPLKAAVSLCPDKQTMPMDAPNGNCNGGGADCHTEERKIFILPP